MNWVKENKFLTGYIIFMVIALGVLGYEVLTASSAYDEAQGGYEKQATEFTNLRKNLPFPSQANLDTVEEQKKDAAKVISAFQVDLSKNEIPLDPISEVGFQDKLKEAVTNVRKKAEEANVRLPDKFFLGFSQYETSPPKPEAAAPLWRELKAIEWVVDQYIEQLGRDPQNAQIASLTRTDLPEEHGTGGGSPSGGGSKGGPSKGPGGGGGPKQGGATGGRNATRDLVHYYSFDVGAICKQRRLQDLLNIISGPKAPQFYVIRQIRAKNLAEKGPPRATPAPDHPEKEGAQTYIVGEEPVETLIRIDIVEFTPPTDASTVAEKSTPAPK